MSESNEGASADLRILIGSVGRRVYLVEWFEAALELLGIDGEIHVTEADPRSSAYSVARFRHLMPRYDSPRYQPAMLELFEQLRPDLFFSVNDLELTRLTVDGLSDKLCALGVQVLALDKSVHRAVNDKYEMASKLAEAEVLTPPTALLSNRDHVMAVSSGSEQVVIKDRFGSGSSGLALIERADIPSAIDWYSRRRTDSAMNPLEQYVLQPAVQGQEYGLDIVAPLAKGAHELGVLARRKIRMRSGETDQAMTVSPAPFYALSESIFKWTNHEGLIDVDVREDRDGAMFVIDINPRFGGGYPFNHLAGADVPALYVSQLRTGQDIRADERLRYVVGAISSKLEGITRAVPPLER